MNFILSMNPALVIFIVSLLISLILVLVYKFFTDQDKMKELKEAQKDSQNKLKELQKEMTSGKAGKDVQKKFNDLQSEMMKKNMEYSSHSMKVSLFTLLPIMLMFSFMNAHYLYEPITPNSDFSMSIYTYIDQEPIIDTGFEYSLIDKDMIKDKYVWTYNFKANNEGIYPIEYMIANNSYPISVIVSNDREYSVQEEKIKDDYVEKIEFNYEKLKPLGKFSLFGWQPGWLGMYIILVLIFNSSLRKLFNVY